LKHCQYRTALPQMTEGHFADHERMRQHTPCIEQLLDRPIAGPLPVVSGELRAILDAREQETSKWR
jgi:hypothetical protein